MIEPQVTFQQEVKGSWEKPKFWDQSSKCKGPGAGSACGAGGRVGGPGDRVVGRRAGEAGGAQLAGTWEARARTDRFQHVLVSMENPQELEAGKDVAGSSFKRALGALTQCWWECELVPLQKTGWSFLRKWEPDVDALREFHFWAPTQRMCRQDLAETGALPGPSERCSQKLRVETIPRRSPVDGRAPRGGTAGHRPTRGRGEVLPSETTWAGLEHSALSRTRQAEKDQDCVVSLMGGR